MNTPMHRFTYTKLTKEQIAQKLLRTAAGPKSVSEFSDALVGKSLKIVGDDAMQQAAEKNTIAFPWDPESSEAPMNVMSSNTPPLSSLLAGKEFTLRLDNDDPAWEYRFIDRKNLQWRSKGEPQWHKETYRAFEADEKHFFGPVVKPRDA